MGELSAGESSGHEIEDGKEETEKKNRKGAPRNLTDEREKVNRR